MYFHIHSEPFRWGELWQKTVQDKLEQNFQLFQVIEFIYSVHGIVFDEILSIIPWN